jgi:hypothetical protein
MHCYGRQHFYRHIHKMPLVDSILRYRRLPRPGPSVKHKKNHGKTYRGSGCNWIVGGIKWSAESKVPD